MPPPLTLQDLVAARHPGARILTASHPVPVLGETNLVALFDDDAAARAAVQRLEAVVASDARLGVVTFAPGRDDEPELRRAAARSSTEAAGDVDPEGVTGLTTRRAVAGGVVSFAVAAVVVALVTWLLTEQAAAAVAAGIGVGLLVAAVGGLVGGFSGFGGSDAWRQTFSPPGRSLTVVAVTALPPDTLDDATRQVAIGARRVERLDAAGRPTDHRD